MRVSVAALVLAFIFTAPLLADAAQARQTSVCITKVSTVSYLTVPDSLCRTMLAALRVVAREALSQERRNEVD